MNLTGIVTAQFEGPDGVCESASIRGHVLNRPTDGRQESIEAERGRNGQSAVGWRHGVVGVAPQCHRNWVGLPAILENCVAVVAKV
jgi:hypothetical protein